MTLNILNSLDVITKTGVTLQIAAVVVLPATEESLEVVNGGKKDKWN